MARAAAAGTRVHSSLLLDRAEERKTLDRLLEAARGGASGALVLRGEPGVGKTALLSYAIGSAAGMQVVCAVGVEAELELALAAVHQLVGPMLDGLDELAPPQRDALAAAFGLIGGAPPDRLLVGLAVLALLASAAEAQPLLCVVDDAQWLDRASAESLAFVARRLSTEGIALLFSVREPPDAQTPLAGLPELSVGGLPEGDARELLARSVRSPLAPRVRDRIIAETRGNPLALLELCGELTRAQLAGGSALPESLPLGGPLERSVVQRLRRLPKETWSLLLLLAAEPGGDMDLFWRAAGELGITEDAARDAEADGLLRVGSQLRFCHPFIRSAIYGAAPLDERRRVHAALARAAARGSDPDRTAWHRAAASPGPDEDVAAGLERSAGRARGRGGHALAASLLARAAELTPDRGRRAERTLAAARAELAAEAPEKALVLLASASSELPDELPRAQAQSLRGALDVALGRGGDTPAMLLEAARALEPLDVRLAREAHLEALEAATRAGRLGTRGGVLAAARAARTAPRVPGAEATAADLLLDGLAVLLVKGHASAGPTLRRAIEALRHEDDLRWLSLGCYAAVERWSDEGLHALTRRQVQLAREDGAPAALARALNQLGTMYEVLAGRFEAAEACFEEAGEIAMGNPVAVGRADPGALIVAAWRGLELPGRALAEVCMRDATARGEGMLVAFAQYAVAVLELGHGRYGTALAAAREATESDCGYVVTWALPELVEAAVRSGERDLAASAVQRLADTALPSGSEWALGMLARSQALAEPDGDAEELYRKAIDHLKRCRARPQLARARLVYGEWLRRERRRVEAREHLRAAHEMFVSLGAEAFAERARIELFATGEHSRQRTIESAQALTAQEARVARLVSEGASNPQVASQLFISPRTVEYHLRKIFRKLGISSRAELVRNF